MRITEQAAQRSLLEAMQTASRQVSRYQAQVTTGRRLTAPSDDPASIAQVMRLDGRIRDAERYRRAQLTVTTRLSTESTTLATVQEVLGTARRAAMGATSPLPGDPVRQAALAQAQALKAQLVDLGNTRVGDEYVFGGTATGAPPFQPSGAYVGNSQVRQVEVEAGTPVPIGNPGDRVLSPAIAALDGLITELQSGTPATIAAQVSTLEAAETSARALEAADGEALARLRRLGQQLGRQTDLETEQRDALRDAPPAESLVRLMTAQSTLERAYAAVNRVLSTRLLDFLR